jgi:hypothetical protein
MLAVLANFVVLSALFRAAQHFVGLVGLLEFVFGATLFADVRVILARQLAVGGLDRLFVRRGLYAEYLVIVFEIHLRNHHRLSNSLRVKIGVKHSLSRPGQVCHGADNRS